MLWTAHAVLLLACNLKITATITEGPTPIFESLRLYPTLYDIPLIFGAFPRFMMYPGL